MPTYTVREGQNVYDVALALYSDAGRAIDIVKSLGQNLDYSIPANTSVGIDSSIEVVPNILKPVILAKKATPPVFYAVRETQNTYDIALQIYGDATKAIDVAMGMDLALDDVPIANSNVKIDYTVTREASVLNYYNVNRIIVSTKTNEKNITYYIATEDSFLILQEDGFKMIVE